MSLEDDRRGSAANVCPYIDYVVYMVTKHASQSIDRRRIE